MSLVCALAACGKVTDNAPDAAPTCMDGVKNGDESDVDCGGSCEGCTDGKFCTAGPDCANGICDNGNCAAPSCSDGVQNGTELDVDCAGPCGAKSCKTGQRCDDNAQCASEMCAGTNICIAPKRVFITVAHHTGNLGGLTGADAKCQAEADAAQLGGTYKAWLSDLTGSPASRFTRSLVAPYQRTDGFPLAQNWDDLTDGTLGGPIDRNAAGNPQTGGGAGCTGMIWAMTNTTAAGNMASDQNSCTNWTSTTGNVQWGRNTDSGSGWTAACFGGGGTGCAVPSALYCFEQ